MEWIFLVEKTIDDLTKIANRAKEQGSFKVSLDFYNKVLFEDPYNINAIRNKIDVLEKIGKFKEAIEAIKILLAIDKDENFESWLQKAKLEMKTDRLDDALLSMEHAEKINPNNEKTLELKYRMLLKLNKKEEASKHLDYALKAFPDSSIFLLMKAEMLFNLKEYKKAEVFLEKCLEKTLNRGFVKKSGSKWSLTLKGYEFIKADIMGGEIDES